MNLSALCEIVLIASWATFGLTPDEVDLISPAPRGAAEGRRLAAVVLARRGILPDRFARHIGMTTDQAWAVVGGSA